MKKTPTESRINLRVPKRLRVELAKAAQRQGRSLANYCRYILQRHKRVSK